MEKSTTLVTRERAIAEINYMKDNGAVLYYFNGNTYTLEFFGEIHAIDTADGLGFNSWTVATEEWSKNYIKNNFPKKWGKVA